MDTDFARNTLAQNERKQFSGLKPESAMKAMVAQSLHINLRTALLGATVYLDGGVFATINS